MTTEKLPKPNNPTPPKSPNSQNNTAVPPKSDGASDIWDPLAYYPRFVPLDPQITPRR
ncbi:MAG: hypothetical protein O3A00_08960 [Planctomycetota bacterium]|nr:hypothetical protein [Planctomycetota bacterium]